MSFIPIIGARKLISILLNMGFKFVRQKGSHAHLEHIINKGRKVTIPVHNKDLPKRTLLSILRQAGITLEDFLKFFGKN